MFPRWWRAASLSKRLLSALGLVLICGGCSLIAFLMRSEASEAQHELRGELALELGLLPSAISELVVAGDYASLEQYLARFVKKPHIANVDFVDSAGASLRHRDKPVPAIAPAWFGPLIGLVELRGDAHIDVGGVRYGTVYLTLTPQTIINHAWERLLLQQAFLLINLAVVLLVVWLVQHRALAPLATLEAAVGQLAEGDGYMRLKEAGSHEVRALIHSFNQMADDLHEAHDSWKFFEVLSEQSIDPAFAVDYDDGCRFVWLNAAAARHFNLSVDEVLQTSVPDWDPNFSLAALELLRNAQREADLPPFETIHQLRDGRVVPIEVATKLIKFKGREYGTGHFRDISERQRQADTLRATRDAAEAGNRAKSEFLANISHEIRTPMNGVLGMAQLLLSGTLDAEQKEQASIIKNSAEALLALINDILDLSRIEAGQFMLSEENYDPRSIAQDVINLLTTNAKDKDITLTAEIDASLPVALHGDPHRLRQILVNLVGNAIKFTEAGTVRLLGETSQGNAARMRWTVSDTGIGISEAGLAKLFQPFTQADGSITRRFGGSGLGLSISKRLVELMGGEIGVTSREGQGSQFWIELPCKAASPVAPSPFGTDQPVPDLPPGLQILLVEDNPINQKVALALLKRLACKVDVADNGEIALTLLSATHYDLILMDCQMPVMDGFETTRRIRHGAAGREAQAIPILAMTANAMAGDREACLEVGMNDYISKPVREDALRQVLSRYTV